jgi:hypothetical protein
MGKLPLARLQLSTKKKNYKKKNKKKNMKGKKWNTITPPARPMEVAEVP